MYATAGILSFGVPNEGMNISRWLKVVDARANEKLIRMLDVDSAHLEQLCKTFNSAFNDRAATIFSWYETDASYTFERVSESA